MLDSALAEIVDSTEKRSTRYWLDHFAERTEELKDASLEALVDRGILERREDGFLVPAGGASQMHGEAHDAFALEGEVRLRIMQCLHGSAIPDPKDAMIICLADACGLLAGILSPPELNSVKPRLELMRQLDQIGRAVSGAIWEVQPPARKPTVRTTDPVPEARGLPLVGNGIDMARDMIQLLLRQYLLLGPSVSDSFTRASIRRHGRYFCKPVHEPPIEGVPSFRRRLARLLQCARSMAHDAGYGRCRALQVSSCAAGRLRSTPG